MEKEKDIIQVTGFQLVYADSRRDNVKLLEAVMVEDIEAYRRQVMEKYGCRYANLNYTVIFKDNYKPNSILHYADNQEK